MHLRSLFNPCDSNSSQEINLNKSCRHEKVRYTIPPKLGFPAIETISEIPIMIFCAKCARKWGNKFLISHAPRLPGDVILNLVGLANDGNQPLEIETTHSLAGKLENQCQESR